ncbi:MAG: RNA polymerase sigma factor [Ignavibacteriae bacterium]|nr:RNA polymerase sigma factor [Ignavibacteriota bacterium]NOG98237.1 RNA polymerase sigma factor [Ignavibacteriota bacterium]
MKTDWDHLANAKNGDEKSAEILFSKYSKSIIKMAALITGSLDSGKDVAQETFLRLINKKAKHHEGSFKTYVTTIAYRLALKEKYRTNKSHSINEKDFIDENDSQINNQCEEETKINIFEAINSLPLNQKEILVLRFYGCHSYEEIAGITKLPIGTVKSRIFYAVKACGKKLKQKGII